MACFRLADNKVRKFCPIIYKDPCHTGIFFVHKGIRYLLSINIYVFKHLKMCTFEAYKNKPSATEKVFFKAIFQSKLFLVWWRPEIKCSNKVETRFCPELRFPFYWNDTIWIITEDQIFYLHSNFIIIFVSQKW